MTEWKEKEQQHRGDGVQGTSLQLDDGVLQPVEEVLPAGKDGGVSKRIIAGGDTMLTSTTPEELFDILIETIRKYHPSDDLTMVRRAYEIANAAHEGQLRKSGEPYIVHPLSVSIILGQLELDKESIIAGILHDVVEDTVMTMEEMTKVFGSEVALLVDGVTKLTQLSWSADKVEIQAENLRKMFLAMAKDIRVILIKLADRLHNMRTLKYMKPEKQKEKARETLEIYAPLADRLGITDKRILEAHYNRGIMYMSGVIMHNDPDSPEMQALLKRMFDRMDPELVFASSKISPGVKKLYAKTRGIKGAKTHPVGYGASLVKKALYNRRNNGPAEMVESVGYYLHDHRSRIGK